MINPDLYKTNRCINWNSGIVAFENYLQHRRDEISAQNKHIPMLPDPHVRHAHNNSDSCTLIGGADRDNIDQCYENFPLLPDSCANLFGPCELDADAYFSAVQPNTASWVLTNRSLPSLMDEGAITAEEVWIDENSSSMDAMLPLIGDFGQCKKPGEDLFNNSSFMDEAPSIIAAKEKEIDEIVYEKASEVLFDDPPSVPISDTRFEQTPEPVFEQTPEPIFEQRPEPVFQKTPEPVFQQTPEPIFEQTPEPVFEQTPEPVLEQASGSPMFEIVYLPMEPLSLSDDNHAAGESSDVDMLDTQLEGLSPNRKKGAAKKRSPSTKRTAAKSTPRRKPKNAAVSNKTKSKKQPKCRSCQPEIQLFSQLCIVCGEDYSKFPSLGPHSRNCDLMNVIKGIYSGNPANFPYPCDECNLRLPLKAELLYHKLLTHAKKKISRNNFIQCSECLQKFVEESLRYHLCHHTGEKLFACCLCEHRFARKHNLKAHKKTVHPEDQPEESIEYAYKSANNPKELSGFFCQICSKIFLREYTLKRDIAKHSELSKCYKCPADNCNFTADTTLLMKKHLITHSLEEDFSCLDDESDCEENEAMPLDKDHEQDSKEFYICGGCISTSKRAARLKRHLSKYCFAKPYKCPFCEFTSALADNVRKHILLRRTVHVGEFVYNCRFQVEGCPFKTNSQKEFRKHLSEEHTKKILISKEDPTDTAMDESGASGTSYLITILD